MLRDDQRIEEIRLVEVGVFDDSLLKFPKNETKGLAEVHIFTGENGCGKSTLLYALACFFAFPAMSDERPLADLKKRLRSDKSQLFGKLLGGDCFLGWKAPEIERLPNMQPWKLGAGNLYYMSTQLSEASDLLSRFQQCIVQDSAWKRSRFPFLPIAYSGQRSLSGPSSALVIREIDESPLRNHLSFNQTVSPERIIQWVANIETQAALALKDKDKSAAEGYYSALNSVTDAINEICEAEYSFVLQRKPLNVVLKRGNLELDFDVLPDGLKSIISWIADVLMRMDRLMWAQPDQPLLHQPLILFLDEIDIHLHPKWQRRVLPVVQKLFPNAQIFVSTHSPFVVGSVRDAWV